MVKILEHACPNLFLGKLHKFPSVVLSYFSGLFDCPYRLGTKQLFCIYFLYTHMGITILLFKSYRHAPSRASWYQPQLKNRYSKSPPTHGDFHPWSQPVFFVFHCRFCLSYLLLGLYSKGTLDIFDWRVFNVQWVFSKHIFCFDIYKEKGRFLVKSVKVCVLRLKNSRTIIFTKYVYLLLKRTIIFFFKLA